MLYNLSKPLDRESFISRSKLLLEKQKVVDLTEKTNRTLKQNNYLHLLLALFAMDYGESLEYVKQNFFKRHVNADIFIEKKNDKILGEVEVLKSSADISKDDMITAIDRFKIWSNSEAGIFLPDSFTFEERVELERMMHYNRNFL